MAYVPDWEPLTDALRRVVAGGATEDEAKLDLCRAVADWKIAVRVHIAADPIRQLSETMLSGVNLPVPSHLSPKDIDWHQSRPLKPWSIGPQPGEYVGMTFSSVRTWQLVDRVVNLIEVSTADVTRILIPSIANGEKSPTKSDLNDGRSPLPKTEPRGKKLKAAWRELMAIEDWANKGVPSTLSCQELANRINRRLGAVALGVSADTVRRLLGKK